MATSTGQNLIDQARFEADVVNNNVVTDPEILTFVNSGVKYFHYLIVDTDESYSLSSLDFALTSTPTVAPPATPTGNAKALPADFYRAQGLDMNPDTDAAYSVPVFSFAKRNDAGYRGHRIQGGGSGGGAVVVMPWRNAGGSYRLYYATEAPQLTTVASLDSNLERVSEGIALHAAIKIRVKREQGITEQQTRLNAIIASVGTMFGNRQALPVQAPMVHSYPGLPFGFGLGRGFDDPSRNGG